MTVTQTVCKGNECFLRALVKEALAPKARILFVCDKKFGANPFNGQRGFAAGAGGITVRD